MGSIDIHLKADEIFEGSNENLKRFGDSLNSFSEAFKHAASSFGINTSNSSFVDSSVGRELREGLRSFESSALFNASKKTVNDFKAHIQSFQDEQTFGTLKGITELRERENRGLASFGGTFSSVLGSATQALLTFASTLGKAGSSVAKVFSGLGHDFRSSFEKAGRALGLEVNNGPRGISGFLARQMLDFQDKRMSEVVKNLSEIRSGKTRAYNEAEAGVQASLNSMRERLKYAGIKLDDDDLISRLRAIKDGDPTTKAEDKGKIGNERLTQDEAAKLIDDYDARVAAKTKAQMNLDSVGDDEKKAEQRVSQLKKIQGGWKEVFSAVYAGLSTISKAAQKAFNEIVQYMASVFKNVIQELQDMAGYDTTNNPYKFNARAVSQQLQTGIGSAENYGLSFALQQMGFSSWSDYLANVGYMTNEQRKRMAEMMERGTERYQSMEDSGFLKAVQEMQVEMQEFKLDFEESIMKFLVENKDAIQSLMQKLIDMLPSLLNFFDFVMNVLGVIMNAVSWLVGGSASSSSSLQVNPTQKLEVVVRSDGMSGSTLRQVGEQLVSQSAYGG